MLSVVLALALAAEPTARPRLVVLSVEAPTATDPATRAAFDDAITREAGRRGYFEVISAREVQVLVGLERQKQLLGCSEGAACLAELSGALGARFILSGTIAPLGQSWQLSLQMQDTQKSLTVGRSTRIAKNLEGLRGLLPWAIAEATGTPAPPAPSKVGPLIMIVSGGLVTAASAAFGLQALGTEFALKRELDRGNDVAGRLETLAAYQQQERSLSLNKTLSLTALIVGGAVLAGGILLWPPDVERGSVAIVPTTNGLVVVGAWP